MKRKVIISKLHSESECRWVPKPFWTGREEIATGVSLISASYIKDGIIVCCTESLWENPKNNTRIGKVFSVLNAHNFPPDLLERIVRILELE
jgi:hypothetical protein